LLTAYLISCAFGGTLLLASMVFGGKDTDSGDGHGGADKGLDKGVGLGDAAAWFPAASMRFWTFLLTFGGAVGAALTVFASPMSAALVGAAALGVGYASGVGAVATVRLLTAKSSDSSTSPSELVGSTGQLLLGAGPTEPGKVRVDVKGRLQDFVAVSDEALPTGERVLVVASQPDGRLVVTRSDDT
jgi:membrane protein implicated in regulation of membrane protease activity